MTTRRFAGSFRKVSKKKKCTKLKDHYTGAMRELVGILDLWASNDHERFVFARVSEIRKRCKYFKSDKSYGPRWIEKGLAELRARNIVSKRLMRVRDHEEKWGYIVAPHACLTMHEDGKCILTGELGQGTSGCWARSGDGGPDSVLYWAGYGDEEPVAGPGDKPGGKPVSGPVHRPGDKPACRPVTTWQLDSDNAEVSPQNRDRTVVTVMHPQEPGEPTKLEEPVEPAPPVQAAAQIKNEAGLTKSQSIGACAPKNLHDVDVTKPLGSDVTIGQQFSIKDDIQLLTEISDGEFNAHAYKQTGDIDLLCEYVRIVVEEIAGVPWDNERATCAGIMDAVAKRINRAGKQYPKGWLLVLKELQKGGACKAVEPYRPPQNPNWVGYQNHDGPPNERDVQAHIHSDFQLCDDWICRSEAGRAAEGFTVKNSVGAWTKP